MVFRTCVSGYCLLKNIQHSADSGPSLRCFQYCKQGVCAQATPLPAATELGDSSVQGTMAGSFLAPDLHMRWEAPAVAASGTADFSRDANRFTCRAPSLDVSGALFLRPPPFDAVKAVLTQACCPPFDSL